MEDTTTMRTIATAALIMSMSALFLCTILAIWGENAY